MDCSNTRMIRGALDIRIILRVFPRNQTVRLSDCETAVDFVGSRKPDFHFLINLLKSNSINLVAFRESY